MKYFTILIFILYCTSLSGQLTLSIQEIKVSNIYIQEDKKLIVEGSNDGPFLSIKFIIINESDSLIKLTPGNSKMYLSFRFNNTNYKEEMLSLSFSDNEIIELKPKQEYHNFVSSRIFLGTSIHLKAKENYIFELMEVLPTIKLHYHQEDFILNSFEIKNVIIKE